MKWPSGIPLLALSALLFHRLPGGGDDDPPNPLRSFKCSDKGEKLRLSTSSTALSWLSKSVEGIILRRVWRDEDIGWYYTEDPTWSEVEVRSRSPFVYHLHGLDSEIEGILLSATDCYSIIAVQGIDTDSPKEKEIIVAGKGNGVWEIQK